MSLKHEPSSEPLHISDSLRANGSVSSSSLLLSSLELSDTQVYAPQIRALLGTASHFCKAAVLKLRSDSLRANGSVYADLTTMESELREANKLLVKVPSSSSSSLLSLQVLAGP